MLKDYLLALPWFGIHNGEIITATIMMISTRELKYLKELLQEILYKCFRTSPPLSRFTFLLRIFLNETLKGDFLNESSERFLLRVLQNETIKRYNVLKEDDQNQS